MAGKQNDLKRAFSEDGALKTHVGGQALIEGVMMRGRYNWAVGVREPAGTIHVEEHDLASGRAKNKWLYWPVVRGCRAFVENLVLGYKALEVAALHAFADAPSGAAQSGDEDGEASAGGGASADAAQQVRADADGCEKGRSAEGDGRFSWKDDFGRPDVVIDALGAQTGLEPVAPSCAQESGAQDGAYDIAYRNEAAESRAASLSTTDFSGDASDETAGDSFEFGKKEMAFSMVLGLVLGVVLFIVAPALIANLLVGEYDSNTLAWNIVDGVVRVAIFVFYIWLIGRMEDIKRMFGYHGAEHKTIHCFEHGLPLTPENARSFPRLHVRCGTAFLIMVMIIAIMVYTVTPLNALIEAWGVPDGPVKLALVIVVRILLMPLIAGISYEITVKWAGSHPENPLVKVILWPGMQMQRLTTREPDDGQIECAIAAMKQVLDREAAEAAKEAEASGTARTASAA